MSVLTERVRAALAPDYNVLEEVASGGMGVVYRARDVALDKIVAIKVMRPDRASSIASRRFLTEARALASVSHPNVVSVHRAGEADGLAYYVMDYVAGETLDARLRRGPLSADEVLGLASDLLAAAGAVHARGIVHRDIKPRNIFLVDGRALLGDFGVAKVASDDTSVTAQGAVVGTPGYMPPEQLAGGAVTARTDLCAIGMVLFEAATGRRWQFDDRAGTADLHGVPARLAPALRGALAWSPEARWPNAAAFRGAIERPPHSRRTPAVAAALLVLVSAAVTMWAARHRTASTTQPVVVIHPFHTGPGAAAHLGDTLAEELVAELQRTPEVVFAFDHGPAAGGLDVEGTVTAVGDSIHVVLRADRFSSPEPLDASGTRDEVLDELAARLVLAVWLSQGSLRGTTTDLPVRALPQTRGGRAQWAHAEVLFAQARWDSAYAAYLGALRTDTTCVLCALRLSLISRWERIAQDTAITNRAVRAVDAFPPKYRLLIDAGQRPETRWAALDTLAARAPDFDLGQFVVGDELFHRGPLVGRPRAEAIAHYLRVTTLNPNFVPAWEHLAWAAIGAGDSVNADRALQRFQDNLDRSDPVSGALFALHSIGRAWRFRTRAEAQQTMDYFLAQPGIVAFPDLGEGPVFLATFDVPEAELRLGEELAVRKDRDLLTPGLAGQQVGLTALGRIEAARRVATRLGGASLNPENTIAAAGLDALLAICDTAADARAAWPRARAALGPLTLRGPASDTQRRRAAWMLTLLARRAGLAREARHWRSLVEGETGRRPLSTFLDADSAARSGGPQRALEISDHLPQLDSGQQSGEPFLRAALHMARARWHAAAGNGRAAIADLRWYENADIVDRSAFVIQAVEADWALGTLARWYAANLMRTEGMTGREPCEAYLGVVRHWSRGDPANRARAQAAARGRADLACPAS